MANCSCGQSSAYSKCCKPYIDGTKVAPSAEALIRSRYTAYVKGVVDYILETHHAESRENLSREATEKWSKESEWLGLDIINVKGGGENDSEGTVEFTARYRSPDRAIVTHHEISTLEKVDGRWYFKDAQMINRPSERQEAKIGRNAPCPCGSGKKYKRCHGA